MNSGLTTNAGICSHRWVWGHIKALAKIVDPHRRNAQHAQISLECLELRKHYAQTAREMQRHSKCHRTSQPTSPFSMTVHIIRRLRSEPEKGQSLFKSHRGRAASRQRGRSIGHNTATSRTIQRYSQEMQRPLGAPRGQQNITHLRA